jgi:beta-glucanase (GH16 family)
LRVRNKIGVFLSLGFGLVVLLLFWLGIDYPAGSQNESLQPEGAKGPIEKWSLVSGDEFDSRALNRQKWTTCYWWDNQGCTNASNHELEWYQPGNVTVQDGKLMLTARKETVKVPNGKAYAYTSGMVTTGPATENARDPAPFAFTYGYVEVRAMVPKGQGLWPAIWLLPADQQSLPEIDVMEILGNDPKTVNMDFHYLNNNGTAEDNSSAWTSPIDLTAGWHTFGLDWEPDRIIWYVDGVQRREFTQKEWIPNQPMYLLINLAVGGDWPGNPNSKTLFPSTFQVDYVRFWKPRHAELNLAASIMNYLSAGSHQIVNYAHDLRGWIDQFEGLFNARHG